MKIGVIFGENRAWWAVLSPVFMKISKTDFSHVGIVISDDRFATVFQSEWPVGFCVDLSEWSRVYKIKYIHYFNVDRDQALNSISYLAHKVRKPYSLVQLVLIAIYKLCPFLRKKMHSIIVNGDYADICTEFVASYLSEFFGVKFSKSKDLIDLNDILDTVRGLNGNYTTTTKD